MRVARSSARLIRRTTIALMEGTPLRILTVMDAFTREALALDVALTTAADRLLGVLTLRCAPHGTPLHRRSDNGAAFVAGAVQAWLAHGSIQTRYIGWLQDAVRWFDHWLKKIDTGMMKEPMSSPSRS